MNKVALLGALTAAPFFISNPAHAGVDCLGFAGACARANATIVTQGNSIVNFFAPGSVDLISSDDDRSGGALTSFTFGTSTFSPHPLFDVSFDWTYSTLDGLGSSFDPFGYLVDGTLFQLSTDGLPQGSTETGSIQFQIASGSTFGAYINSTDSIGGTGAATITNFTVTSVPGPLPLMGAAAAFGYSRKIRKRIQSSRPDVISTIG